MDNRDADWSSTSEPGSVIRDESKAARLVALCESEAIKFFHDPDGCGYASIYGNCGQVEHWPLDSRQFKEWLGRRYYLAYGAVASGSSLSDALATLNGRARFEGEQRDVHLRVAKHEGKYYIDLCNDDWKVIAVDANGWEVTASPVVFRRNSNMRALPAPKKGRDIGELPNFVNIPRHSLPLVVAWLVDCFRPDTPKPVLELHGEKGTGKTKSTHYLRQLVDPNKANNRAKPKATEDLFVAGANSWCISLNNVSHLKTEMQDALCSLATGDGWAGRQLYTNLEESCVELKRPILLNGINQPATRADLIDRVITLQLELIPDSKAENVMDMAFEAARPGLLGALLDIFVAALRELQEVHLEKLPRMADFAMLGEVVTRVMDWPRPFSEIYAENRRQAVLTALESCPVALALLEYMANKKSPFEGTIKQLLMKLQRYKEDNSGWPKSAKGLANALRRNIAALRTAGIVVKLDPIRKSDGFHVSVSRVEDLSSQSSSSSQIRQLGELREHDEHVRARLMALPLVE